MNRRILTILATLILLSSSADAGSIWDRAEKSSNRLSLYQDDKASGIGDVLTITIDESATVETKKGRTMDKTNTNEGSGSGQFELGDPMPMLPRYDDMFRLPSYQYSNSSGANLTGKADYKDEQTYEDSITVVVEDVMPNGNLLVLGKRTREVAGNIQTIQLSGIVRPSDIDEFNTVNSQRVANFHIVYATRGQENSFLRPGWLMRIWNLLNPF